MSNILKKGYGVVRDLASHLKVSNIILFESINDFDGSSLEVYNFLRKNGYDKKYKLIWSVKNPESRKNKNYNSIAYLAKSFKNLYYENKARYVFFEDLPPVARRKTEQTVIYLSHGSPFLKNCKGNIVLQDKCDYSICTNDDTKDFISYQLTIDKDKLFVCGLPRNDVLFKKHNELSKLTQTHFEKVILWLPTFRKLEGRIDSQKEYFLDIPAINSADDLCKLNEFAKIHKTLLIIKFHPRAAVDKIPKHYSNIIILSDKEKKALGVETYPLLTQIDALISDYSSIAFDYLLLDRPIGFVTEDMKDYTLGFALPDIENYMPGEKINSFDDLCSFIKDVASDKDEYSAERKRVCDWANKYRDSNNAKRVAERFIEK